MENTYRVLLGISLYELSEKYLYELREDKRRDREVFNILPKFTINTNEGAKNRPISADYFLQFIGFTPSDNKYLLFDFRTIDAHLDEEISNAGYDGFFEQFDFIKLLKEFPRQTDNDMMKYNPPNINYLVFDLEYIHSTDSEGYSDCDMNVYAVGYLNSKMELIKFNE